MRRLRFALLALTLWPASVFAETDLLGGAALLVGSPRGPFDEVVGTGWGLEGHALLTPAGRPFGLRIDGAFLVYGSETITVPFSGTGGRVGLDVTTDNWIGSLSVGPELTARSGPVRPYVHALAGVAYFATTSEVKGRGGAFPLARSTNFDDSTFRWSVGGGVNLAVGRRVAVDVGLAWVSNDRVSYLAQGDIQDDGHGGVVVEPRRSRVDLVQLTIGVTGGW